MTAIVLVALLTACAPEPGPWTSGRRPGSAGTGPDGGSGSVGTADAGTGSSTGGGDSAEPSEWVVLPSDCTPPAPDGRDPFTITGQVNNTQTTPGGWFVEHLDVAWIR